MKILATYNIKSGVGKTAAAVNLSWMAARDGSSRAAVAYEELWLEVRARIEGKLAWE